MRPRWLPGTQLYKLAPVQTTNNTGLPAGVKLGGSQGILSARKLMTRFLHKVADRCQGREAGEALPRHSCANIRGWTLIQDHGDHGFRRPIRIPIASLRPGTKRGGPGSRRGRAPTTPAPKAMAGHTGSATLAFCLQLTLVPAHPVMGLRKDAVL